MTESSPALLIVLDPSDMRRTLRVLFVAIEVGWMPLVAHSCSDLSCDVSVACLLKLTAMKNDRLCAWCHSPIRRCGFAIPFKREPSANSLSFFSSSSPPPLHTVCHQSLLMHPSSSQTWLSVELVID